MYCHIFYSVKISTIDYLIYLQITSVTFGGANLDELYVTTAKKTIGGITYLPPVHGGTYKVTGLNAKGYPGVSVVL